MLCTSRSGPFTFQTKIDSARARVDPRLPVFGDVTAELLDAPNARQAVNLDVWRVELAADSDRSYQQITNRAGGERELLFEMHISGELDELIARQAIVTSIKLEGTLVPALGRRAIGRWIQHRKPKKPEEITSLARERFEADARTNLTVSIRRLASASAATQNVPPVAS